MTRRGKWPGGVEDRGSSNPVVLRNAKDLLLNPCTGRKSRSFTAFRTTMRFLDPRSSIVTYTANGPERPPRPSAAMRTRRPMASQLASMKLPP
jgi:hypothetical protein